MRRMFKQNSFVIIYETLKSRFSALSMGNKIQVVAATVVTLVLVIGVPVYAWFVLGGKIEAFTKIKEPDNLDIRAAHYDAIQYFDLSDIDIEAMNTNNTPHRVVFSVSAGDYKIPYQIQLAHTTNNPFKYRLFRATEYTGNNPPANPAVTYISVPLKNQGESEANYTFYYVKYAEVTLTAKNPDSASVTAYGRELALGSGNYYTNTYDGSDEPEIYAVPIYEQSGRINYDPNSEHDYFVLEISYDSTARTTGNFSEWNTAENKKETDMIYLTASRFTTE